MRRWFGIIIKMLVLRYFFQQINKLLALRGEVHFILMKITKVWLNVKASNC